MFEIRKSDTYEQWFRKLKDRQARVRINARIRRIEDSGNFGDVKPVREGISEMRIDYGPGYRIYFMQRGSMFIVLLAGGDKSTQDANIKSAIKIAKEWRD
ncbi:MAG: type II toxin-antitoxin system RelE/ParE family toxin [Betaproteobacteria bacterium]|nr:type II toxin-antitoxin system RelE/ParE family toxin [Betaproteobacteria bacterium]